MKIVIELNSYQELKEFGFILKDDMTEKTVIHTKRHINHYKHLSDDKIELIRTVNKKIHGIWRKKDFVMMSRLLGKKLKATKQLIYRYIGIKRQREGKRW